MSRNTSSHQWAPAATQYALTGVLIGATVGGLIAYLDIIGWLTVPKTWNILVGSPVAAIISGAMIGGLVGASWSYLIKLPKIRQNEIKSVTDGSASDGTLPLREEKLAISKEWVKAGDISMRTEILKEDRNITVPITREELVIEKTTLDVASSEQDSPTTETIRIPLSEEHIEVTKHRVVLEDVDVYKRKFQEIEHFDEVLKKEKLKVKSTGDTKVVIKDKKED